MRYTRRSAAVNKQAGEFRRVSGECEKKIKPPRLLQIRTAAMRFSGTPASRQLLLDFFFPNEFR